MDLNGAHLQIVNTALQATVRRSRQPCVGSPTALEMRASTLNNQKIETDISESSEGCARNWNARNRENTYGTALSGFSSRPWSVLWLPTVLALAGG